MHLDPRSLKYHLQKIKSKRKSKASTTKNLFWQGALARLKTRAFEYLYATANDTFHHWPYYLATEKYFPLPLNCIIQDKSLLCFWNTFFLSFVCLVATCHARIELLFTWLYLLVVIPRLQFPWPDHSYGPQQKLSMALIFIVTYFVVLWVLELNNSWRDHSKESNSWIIRAVT